MSDNIEQKIVAPISDNAKIDEAKTIDGSKIEQKIIQIVAETLRISESTITSGSKFVDDLAADSLDLVELMMAIEEAFRCEIPDEETKKISTVADAVEYVTKHLNT